MVQIKHLGTWLQSINPLRWYLNGLEKALEQSQQQQRVEELEAKLAPILREIILFPGNKSEFEEFAGYETAFVDLNGNDKGLVYDVDYRRFQHPHPFHNHDVGLQQHMVNESVVALVNASRHYAGSQTFWRYCYGMPVKKA